MKKLSRKAACILGFMCVMMAVALVSARVSFAEKGLTRIADNVYSYVDVKNGSPSNSFGANAGIIIGKDGIVVVDTLMTAKEAKRFIGDIRAVSDKPIKYVVDTHYHLDHAWGNAEFAKLGALVVAHRNDRENLLAKGGETLKGYKGYGISKEDIEGTEISLPVLTFDSRMDIFLGDRTVILTHPGPAHTNGDTLVYLPDKKILFTGDIVFTNFHPYLAEGDLTSWAGVLDTILAMDVERIIPGHGPLSTKKDVRDMKTYLVIFDAKAKELCSKSKDPKYIYGEMLRALPPKEGGAFIIDGNIEMRYLKK